MVFSHHGGAGETFVFIKTGIFSRKIHLINRFSEYLIILNFSFWWIWSLKKLRCLFDFKKAQDKIRRQRKQCNQPLHVFTIQPASLSNMMVPTSSGRSPKRYFQISFQDAGWGQLPYPQPLPCWLGVGIQESFSIRVCIVRILSK